MTADADDEEMERLRSAPKPASVVTLLPRLPALIQSPRPRPRATGRARAPAAVRQALDVITIRPVEAARHVVVGYGLVPVRMATGTESESVVAGARFGAYRLEAELR